MRKRFYAIYQIGGPVWGVGENFEAALIDAKRHTRIEADEIKPDNQAVEGDRILVECSTRLYEEARSHSGYIDVQMQDGILFLTDELKVVH